MLQPGLNLMTYNVLQSEELLLPSVLRFPREDDLHSLDVSIAQRCLLRSLMSTVTEHLDYAAMEALCGNLSGNELIRK